MLIYIIVLFLTLSSNSSQKKTSRIIAQTGIAMHCIAVPDEKERKGSKVRDEKSGLHHKKSLH